MEANPVIDIKKVFSDRGISPSYPYFSIAKKHRVPYRTLLTYFFGDPGSPWFKDAAKFINLLSPGRVQTIALEVHYARAYYAWQQRGYTDE